MGETSPRDTANVPALEQFRQEVVSDDPEQQIFVAVTLTAGDMARVNSIIERGWADHADEVVRQAIRGLDLHLRARERGA